MNAPLSWTPERYVLGASEGHGSSPINAFDAALRGSGFADYNLLRVSSILPAGAKRIDSIPLTKGSIVPCVYASITSSNEGVTLSSVVALGIPERESDIGVIMEYSALSPLSETEEKCRMMVEEAFALRSLALKRIEITSAEAVVRGITCAFAGVALL
jgi:arginine decarboxylase